MQLILIMFVSWWSNIPPPPHTTNKKKWYRDLVVKKKTLMSQSLTQPKFHYGEKQQLHVAMGEDCIILLLSPCNAMCRWRFRRCLNTSISTHMYTALKAAHLKLEDCKHLSSDIHFQLHGVAFTPHAHTVVVRIMGRISAVCISKCSNKGKCG